MWTTYYYITLPQFMYIEERQGDIGEEHGVVNIENSPMDL